MRLEAERPGTTTLHLIRTDVLLYAISAFADEERRHSDGKGQTFTPADIELIRHQYELFSTPDGRLQWGKAAELAQRLGRGQDGIRGALHQMRKRGVLPPLRPRTPVKRRVAKRQVAPMPPREPRRAVGQSDVYLREWLSERASQRIAHAPLLDRPDWFDEKMDLARLMAGR